MRVCALLALVAVVFAHDGPPPPPPHGSSFVTFVLFLVVGLVLVWSLCALASWGHTYRTVRRYYEQSDPVSGARYGYIEDVYDDGVPATPVYRERADGSSVRIAYRVPPNLA